MEIMTGTVDHSRACTPADLRQTRDDFSTLETSSSAAAVPQHMTSAKSRVSSGTHTLNKSRRHYQAAPVPSHPKSTNSSHLGPIRFGIILPLRQKQHQTFGERSNMENPGSHTLQSEILQKSDCQTKEGHAAPVHGSNAALARLESDANFVREEDRAVEWEENEWREVSLSEKWNAEEAQIARFLKRSHQKSTHQAVMDRQQSTIDASVPSSIGGRKVSSKPKIRKEKRHAIKGVVKKTFQHRNGQHEELREAISIEDAKEMITAMAAHLRTRLWKRTLPGSLRR